MLKHPKVEQKSPTEATIVLVQLVSGHMPADCEQKSYKVVSRVATPKDTTLILATMSSRYPNIGHSGIHGTLRCVTARHE